MAKSIVAIVGRPNVGKSTLFNRLCRKRSAIVDFEEGITRDRKYEEAEWLGQAFVIVDTGGIIPKSADTINKAIKFQAEIAIQEADFILFVVDAHTGTTDIDVEIAKILSPHRQKVMLVINKVDNEKFEMETYDFLQLGFGDGFPLSAAQGRNTGNFLDELLKNIKTEKQDDDKKKEENTINIAIVGKPNVGKSSITNRLIGENTVIVNEVPGTTRDSIDSILNYQGKKLVFIDTAGLRKKKKIKYGVEYFSSMRTIESINRADVVLLVLDANDEVSTQDQKIASYAARNFKDLIIVVNKWDLIKKETMTSKKFEEKIFRELKFIEHAPIIFVSALTGQRVRKMLDILLEVENQSHNRIPTSQLNEFLEKAIGFFPPSHSSGRHSKIFYCSQVRTHPPTFIFFCNDTDLITVHYKRYLHNRLRDTFGFKGATIKLLFRGRKKNDFED